MRHRAICDSVFDNLFQPFVQQYIRDHENSDLARLLLADKAINGVPAAEIVQQINGRKKTKDKIPTFYKADGIVFPPSVSLEQSSSETTAVYKSSFLSEYVGTIRTLVDLTGGFGVDSFFFSKKVPLVTYVEPHPDLFEIARHNHRCLGSENIRHFNLTAENFLGEHSENFDVAFIDPSRRVQAKKIFSLADSEPDILDLQSKILDRAPWLLVKASPMMDLQLAITQLKNVAVAVALAVDNEMKELLLLCRQGFNHESQIIAENISRNGSERFLFTFQEEARLQYHHSGPKEFIYEPNAAIMKVGAFKSIGKAYGLDQISANTHYYTSEKMIGDFPGRIFRIEHHIKPNKAAIKYFVDGKANITTRNYPMSADELKKQTGLKDGGEKFLIGFSGQTKKFVVVASRLK